MRCDQQGPRVRHVVHRHCHIRLADLLQLHRALPHPELHACVPAAADYEGVVGCWVHDTEDVFHGLGVGAKLTHLVCREVPFVDVVVRATKQDASLVQLPAQAQDAGRQLLDSHLAAGAFGRLLLRPVTLLLDLDLPN